MKNVKKYNKLFWYIHEMYKSVWKNVDMCWEQREKQQRKAEKTEESKKETKDTP